jgi:hypothetical protein
MGIRATRGSLFSNVADIDFDKKQGKAHSIGSGPIQEDAMRTLCACFVILASFVVTSVCTADTITGVAFFGNPANPTITIYGSGFGTAPAPTVLGYPGFTGYDYGNDLYIEDLSTTHGFSAGRGVPGVNTYDLIGLNILSYTDTSITYQLGSDYAQYYYPVGLFALDPGDSFEVVTDAIYFGTVSYTATTPEPASLIGLVTGILPFAAMMMRRRVAHT